MSQIYQKYNMIMIPIILFCSPIFFYILFSILCPSKNIIEDEFTIETKQLLKPTREIVVFKNGISDTTYIYKLEKNKN